MSFRVLSVLLSSALAVGCADDPAMRPQPQPPLDPCRADEPCTAGHCPGAQKITTGTQRCALLCDKTVRCSAPGGLFPRPANDAPLEVVVSGALDFASGAQHSCALLDDGTVTCWGNNRWGALGYLPDRSDHWYAPTAVPGLSNVVALDSRDAFYQFDWTCALQQDANVACWGTHLEGVTRIPELQGVSAIRVGDHDVYGLVTDRRIRMYSDRGGAREFELPEPVRDWDAGWEAFCAGSGTSLGCIDLIYQEEIVAMPLPAAYANLTHSQAMVLLMDDRGQVHATYSREPEVWTRLPELDGTSSLTTHTAAVHEVCGLFSDGRITCVDHR